MPYLCSRAEKQGSVSAVLSRQDKKERRIFCGGIAGIFLYKKEIVCWRKKRRLRTRLDRWRSDRKKYCFLYLADNINYNWNKGYRVLPKRIPLKCQIHAKLSK